MGDMNEFKEALCSISAIPFDTLPPESELPDFLRKAYAKAELVLSSIPDPPNAPQDTPATPFTPAPSNSAKTGTDTFCDPALVPGLRHPEDAHLKKQWGKPLKISNNPLGVACYKTAAHDRHGAWFCRHSLHQGLGFERWKRGMQREFLSSLKVQEGPGIGAVRGISADRRIEKREFPGVGKVEVWQTSSAFPGPVTPRAFLTLLITSDNAMTRILNKGADSDAKPGRSFLVLSRPTDHPEALARPQLVDANYESIELIRELPLSSSDPESNPVEWLMITRSDPGGGIPKFMVERGTPGSIVADVLKWLNWACKEEETGSDTYDDEDAVVEHQNEIEKEMTAEEEANEAAETRTDQTNGEAVNEASNEKLLAPKPERHVSKHSLYEQPQESNSGVFSRFADAMGTMSGYLPKYLSPPRGTDLDADSSDTSSISSEGTFASANDRVGGELEPFPALVVSDTNSAHQGEKMLSSESISPAPSNEQAIDENTPHGREIAKLVEKRQALDAQMARNRESDATKHAEARRKESKEQEKALSRIEKERQKQETRYRREIEKIDARRIKEEKKAQEKQRKAMAKDEVMSLKRECSEWKERTQVAEKELELLRKQLDKLQRENSAFVARLTLSDSGSDTIRRVREEAGRSRAGSRGSRLSTLS